VSDDGKGMDRETLAKVFEPFYTTKGLGQGTGLGLATVYGAIKQNQGLIDVYSEPGMGTTFTIYLPNHQDSNVDKSAKSDLSMQKGHGETILFVEDESTLLRMGEIMLQELGYEVLVANSPKEAILPILRRLAGENINLTWTPGKGSYPIKIDPVQLDQILTNLIVNARDAITNTGTISLESGKVSLDQAYCDRHAGFIPGIYIMLMVSDDGKGMDSETLSKVFEPFYTTKGLGQGTGLGLATVYGAIKQNQGFIDVYSEPGMGTTFTIYLPNHQESNVDKSAKSDLSMQKGRGETILFVEDESALLRIGEIMLQELGYEVLVANSPKEAIRLAEKYINEIDLLLTDIIMPGMNGKDLAEHLRTLNADLKVLFISGHTADIISEQGTLDENINFLQKPFLMKELAANLRDSLEK